MLTSTQTPACPIFLFTVCIVNINVNRWASCALYAQAYRPSTINRDYNQWLAGTTAIVVIRPMIQALMITMAIEVYQLSRMLDRSDFHEQEQPQGFPPTVICPDIIFFPIHNSMRSLRVVVMEKPEPLSSLRSAREFAQVFYDILQIHRWLYKHPKILHCDLSMANIMFRREGDEVYGVLNDFDLSSFRSRMDKDLTSKHQTGTKPFMACDLLNLEWDKGHL
ncbi:hypothetical protein D9757_013097 [Collybiopsis confluens]|uniref:Fungal-type protein kinase domain-containing protein n=1 Tax=Collybiopsis confluens TaxID=2823264 RepID=A0A8H5GHS5_9AGAR|nr:hypothetical protein D9757_013097 [Collybiopsis confluens]